MQSVLAMGFSLYLNCLAIHRSRTRRLKRHDASLSQLVDLCFSLIAQTLSDAAGSTDTAAAALLIKGGLVLHPHRYLRCDADDMHMH